MFKQNNQLQYVNSPYTCSHSETKVIYSMYELPSMERDTTSINGLSRIEICKYCGKMKTQILNGVYYVKDWQKVER